MYRPSPNWTLLYEDDRAIASAGADELYLLDELDGAQARRLVEAWRAGTLDALAGGELRPMLEKLAQLGVLLKVARAPGGTLRYAVRGLGAEHAALERLIGELAREAGGLQRSDEDPDLIAWFRAGGTLLDALGDYRAVRAPHLFVDVAYHHTLSLGPLVWPGETACLGCYGGRIRHVWGDPEPPRAPLAAAHAPLIAALVVEQLRQFAATGSCPALVERAVAFNLPSLETRAERVHRLPWCPFCFPPETPYGAGSFALPWMVNP
ncbi:MAG TPA: hypothetical protein VFF06_13530 [Polyangia bacterium]|nr:hypothetical protein [Polyangia bacterium]